MGKARKLKKAEKIVACADKKSSKLEKKLAKLDKKSAKVYDAAFPEYQQLYRSLKDDFKRIAKLA